MSEHLRKKSKRLVNIVAGRRDDGEMLMDLINRGKLYRFLLKPVSPGRARLAVEASVKHHLEAPSSAFKSRPAAKVAKPKAAPKSNAAPKPKRKAKAPPKVKPAPKPKPKAKPAPKAKAAPKPKPQRKPAPQARAAPKAKATPQRAPVNIKQQFQIWVRRLDNHRISHDALFGRRVFAYFMNT